MPVSKYCSDDASNATGQKEQMEEAILPGFLQLMEQALSFPPSANKFHANSRIT